LTFFDPPPIIETYEYFYFFKTHYAPRESGPRPLAHVCRESDQRCVFDRSETKVKPPLLSATANYCGGFVLNVSLNI